MGIESLKRWHWIVIGALLGLTVGYSQTVVGFDPLRAEPRALAQQLFEEELHQRVNGRPKLKNVTLYPDGSLLLVKLQRLMLADDGRTFVYGQWQMTPPVPYRPATMPPRDNAPNYTVANFLADVAGKDPSISYRFAWWATKPMTILLWTVGGLVVVGGIWPFVVNLLIGAGFGRPRPAEDEYDLSRFQSEADLNPAAVPNDEDGLKLKALEEELSKNLEGGAFEQAPGAASPAPPMTLASEPLQPAAPVAEEDKDFAGEFYPVAHGAKKKPPAE